MQEISIAISQMSTLASWLYGIAIFYALVLMLVRNVFGLILLAFTIALFKLHYDLVFFETWLQFGLFAIGYLIVGIVWSAYKWYYTSKEIYNTNLMVLVEKYIKTLPNNAFPVFSEDRVRLGNVEYFYDKITTDYERATCRANASAYSEDIIYWVLGWWCSMIVHFLFFTLPKAYTTCENCLEKVYNKLTYGK